MVVDPTTCKLEDFWIDMFIEKATLENEKYNRIKIKYFMIILVFYFIYIL